MWIWHMDRSEPKCWRQYVYTLQLNLLTLEQFSCHAHFLTAGKSICNTHLQGGTPCIDHVWLGNCIDFDTEYEI